ncbi:hypothetical protein Btru_071252 [Bulinus truncatus]|nr:hypothetical protein Btru_071252 [Bulinus truncatus]
MGAQCKLSDRDAERDPPFSQTAPRWELLKKYTILKGPQSPPERPTIPTRKAHNPHQKDPQSPPERPTITTSLVMSVKVGDLSGVEREGGVVRQARKGMMVVGGGGGGEKCCFIQASVWRNEYIARRSEPLMNYENTLGVNHPNYDTSLSELPEL